MTSSFRRILLAAACFGAIGAGYGETTPLGLQIFPRQVTRIAGETWCATQDQHGRMWLGTYGIVRHDGFTWRRLPAPGQTLVRGLAEDAEGRMWCAGANAVGYFSAAESDAPVYHDLTATLPAHVLPLGDVWHVFVDGPRVLFMTGHVLLCREGGAWTHLTSFSGIRRAPACSDQGSVYVHHLPSGLYRVVQGVPELLIPASTGLPATLAVYHQPDGSLLLGTQMGWRSWDGHSLRAVLPAIERFMQENQVAAITRGQDGRLFVGTMLHGAARVLADGSFETLGTAPPLSSEIDGFATDRDGGVWLLGAAFVARLPRGQGKAEAAYFDLPEVQALTATSSSVWAATQQSVWRIDPRGPDAPPRRQPGVGGHYRSIGAGGDEILAGRREGIDRIASSGTEPVWSLPGQSIGALLPVPGGAWAANRQDAVWQLRAGNGPALVPVRRIQLDDTAVALASDGNGGLWIGMWQGGVRYLPPGASQPQVVLTPEASGKTATRLAGTGERVAAVTDGAVWTCESGGRLARLARIPSGPPLAAAMDPSRRRLFIALQSGTPAGDAAVRLGWCSVAGDDAAAAAWHDVALPGLARIGPVRSLACVAAPGGKIALWLAGGDGVAACLPDAAPAALAPPLPFLERAVAGDANLAGTDWRLAYARNQLVLRFGTSPYDTEGGIFLSTRLQGEAWGRPVASPVVEFSHLREGHYQVEARLVDAAGTPGPALSLPFTVAPPWYRTPAAYAGAVGAVAAVVALAFVWRQRRMTRANHRLQRLVQERTSELERANRAKDEFVAGISHEIRNPLNGIVGLTAALEATASAPAQRHQLEMMRYCADHLSGLIEDVLDFARIQSGDITVVRAPFSVVNLLTSVRAVMAEASTAAGIPIDLAPDRGVPLELLGDAPKIRQVLINFVSNAIKYAGRGRVRLSASAEPLPDGRWDVTFGVADEGPGIASGEQAELFTRFKRGALARAANIPGTGLGLAVSRTLAEKMGGSTAVTSEVGTGACFYLRLPLALPEPPPASAPAPTEIRGEPWCSLIVEDQEFNSTGLAALLGHLGIRSQVAASAEQALALLELHHYPIILVDRDLPGMSGIELARRIRAAETGGRRAWIVATTGATTRDAVAEYGAAGMDGFLAKPITLQKLRGLFTDLGGASRAAPPLCFDGRGAVPAEPWNLSTLRYIAGSDEAEFARRLRGYVRELDGYLAELEAAAGAADFEALSRWAHRAVGHLAVIEHAALLTTAQQIEEAAVNRDMQAAAARLGELVTGAHSVRVRLLAAAENAPAA